MGYCLYLSLKFKPSKFGSMQYNPIGCHPIVTVGYGRNKAISQSKGEYLCFLDAVRS